MSKNSFFDNCCCGKDGNKPNSCTDENSNSAYLMIFIVFIIFMGVPFGNDCFWHGYCNAYNTSGFGCRNQGNNASFNSNNNSTGLFGNFQQQNNSSGSNTNSSINDLFSNLQQQFNNTGTDSGTNNSLSSLFNSFQQQ